jgi:hypothetical protein
MTDLADQSRFAVRSTAITWDRIGDEIVAINLSSGHYYSLRHTAHDLFLLLDAGRTIGDLVAAVSGDADPATTRPEVLRFLGHLLDAGLVEVTEGAESTAGSTPPDGRTDGPVELLAGPYAPPHLETFTDLEDLMLLDPVHEVDDDGWPSAATDA